MPNEVLDHLAVQLGIEDPSCVKRYTERRSTRFEHQEEIRQVCELKDFPQVEEDFARWVDARAWMTGDGPKVIFYDGWRGCASAKVLLPGVSTLARLDLPE